MIHTRKKLLLREDEAEMVEFALGKIAGGFEEAGKEYSAMQVFARSEEATGTAGSITQICSYGKRRE